MSGLPTLRQPTEGCTIAVVGDVYRFLVTGDDTHGTYATWEAIVLPGGGPPPNVHSREEEGFYILEGKITLQIGDKRMIASLPPTQDEIEKLLEIATKYGVEIRLPHP